MNNFNTNFDDNDLNNTLNSLSNILPVGLSLTLAHIGKYKVKKIIYEEKLKGIDKKDLFNYLIQDRIFMNSICDKEIKKYNKYFKNIYLNRKKKNL